MHKGLYRFPNGRLIRVSAGRICGTTAFDETPAGLGAASPTDLRRALSSQITGNDTAMADMHIERTGSFASYDANVGEFLDGVAARPVDASAQTQLALQQQYALIEVEARHALLNLDNDYGSECCVPLANGRELRSPAFPEECSYVRVVKDGLELAYWTDDEFRDQAAEVMGALVGSMRGRSC